jgi:hypothetical protein
VIEGEDVLREFLAAVLAGVFVSKIDVVSRKTDRERGVAMIMNESHDGWSRVHLAHRVDELIRMRTDQLGLAEVAHADSALPRNYLEWLVALT